MRVAEVLSDLTSLRPEVCDPDAALALVSERPEGKIANAEETSIGQSDKDLERAKDLVHLHKNVKLAHADGMDKELNEARKGVAEILKDIRT